MKAEKLIIGIEEINRQNGHPKSQFIESFIELVDRSVKAVEWRVTKCGFASRSSDSQCCRVTDKSE